MKEKRMQGQCMASLGSMTQAMQARGALAGAAIRAEIVETDGNRAKRGCAYAVTFPCDVRENVRRVLKSAGIRVREYYEGENR